MEKSDFFLHDDWGEISDFSTWQMYRYLKFLHITDFFPPRVHLWFRWQISGMYWQSRVLQKPLKCIRNRHQFRISTNSTKKEIKFNWPFQNQAIAIELKRKVLAGNTDESIFTLLQSGLELILLFPYYSPPPTSQSCHRVSGFSASVVHLSSSSFSSAISSVSVSSWPLTPAGSPVLLLFNQIYQGVRSSPCFQPVSKVETQFLAFLTSFSSLWWGSLTKSNPFSILCVVWILNKKNYCQGPTENLSVSGWAN